MATPESVVEYHFGAFHQTRMDYDGSGNLIYLGMAQRGKLAADAHWIVWKHTYDASNSLTLIQTSGRSQIWDNRASLTYA